MTFRSLSCSRYARPAILSAALLVAAGGTTAAAWSADTKTVDLSVDGASRSLSLHGDTVSDVLARAHVTVGAHDLLAPAASTRIQDGSRIVLRHGREMDVVVDGVHRTVWVTAASVGEAIGQIDPRFENAQLSADRSREIPLKGFSLDVRTRKSVTFVAAGKRSSVITTGLLVRDALAAAKLVVRPTDRLSVAPQSPLVDGAVITLTRLDKRMHGRWVAIPYESVQQPDSSLTRGSTRVVKAGAVGYRYLSYTWTYADGRLVSTPLTANRLVRAPITRVVAVGTKAAPVARPVSRPAPSTPTRRPATRSSSSSGGLNWGALANCESGGNPRAVSSSGTYRGLYQFSLGTWHSVGGSGDPINASGSEQTHRAQILYSSTGASSWPVCGKYL